MPVLVLASTSRYRRELLQRLRLPFEVLSPGVDETPLAHETPPALALRLAVAKADAGAAMKSGDGRDVVVIGADQVADLDGRALGKPGDHARAAAQLAAMRGRAVRFETAVAVVRPRTGWRGSRLVTVTVRFRPYTAEEAERYLRLEQPYDCAGSAKAEALGIALVDAIASDDPTALVGLPLIATCALLREAGVDPLGEAGRRP